MSTDKRSEVKHNGAMYYVWRNADGKIVRVTTIDGRPMDVPKGMNVSAPKPTKTDD